MSKSRRITSRHNQQFKRWVSLLESQGTRTHQQCLVSGNKLRKEITQNSPASICEILFPPSSEIGNTFQLEKVHYILSKELFDELDILYKSGKYKEYDEYVAIIKKEFNKMKNPLNSP